MKLLFISETLLKKTILGLVYLLQVQINCVCILHGNHCKVFQVMFTQGLACKVASQNVFVEDIINKKITRMKSLCIS